MSAVPIPFISFPRSIGGIVPNVTISEEGSDELIITEHPVEQGSTISDHAYGRPAELTVKYGWSNSSFEAGGDSSYVQKIYAQLLALQETRMPLTVFTGKRVYTNMLVQSLRQVTDITSEFSLMITAHCKQVIIAQTQTTTLNAANMSDPSTNGPVQQGGNQSLAPAPNANTDNLQTVVISGQRAP